MRQEQNTKQYFNKLSCSGSGVDLGARGAGSRGLSLGSPQAWERAGTSQCQSSLGGHEKGCAPEDLDARALSLVAWEVCFVLCT